MNQTTEATQDVGNLSPRAVDAQSLEYSWVEKELSREWDSFEAIECEECGFIGVYRPVGECRCSSCGEGYITAEGPMMDNPWPLPERTLDGASWYKESVGAAQRLNGLPLALVLTWDEYGKQTGAALALTGGGMDLSWEIAEAYMRLGFLPPYAVVSSLPKMSGPVGVGKKAVILALDELAVTFTQRANRLHEQAADLQEWYQEEADRWS